MEKGSAEYYNAIHKENCDSQIQSLNWHAGLFDGEFGESKQTVFDDDTHRQQYEAGYTHGLALKSKKKNA